MINVETTTRSWMDPADMSWQASPSSHVQRKRFYLDGEAESGRVTSLVRYLPDARFKRHGHPQGEEILVLDGIFSDASGDWGTGTWLLNPEGYAHAPYSGPGCLLFVKLRQYTGTYRRAIALDSLPWEAADGYCYRDLDVRPDSRTRVLSLPAHAAITCPADGLEGFVVQGQVIIWDRVLGQHSWFRVPAGDRPIIESGQDCLLYVEERGQFVPP